jgi:hypothetical protein
MKYIITFSIALALSFSSSAQTGLVFSQCLTFGGDTWTTVSGNSYSQEFIVPVGKIWKIEHASIVNTNGTLWNRVLQINAFDVAYFPNNYSTFPIWVKSGDVIRFSGGGGDYFLSILEFQAN